MTMTTIDRPLISTVIPLYKSKRWVPDIIRNIEGINYEPSEIIISDRHGLDDAIDIIEEHFEQDDRVTCIRSSDGADWVSNIDFLLRYAKGKYWRMMPHDDTFESCDLEVMQKIFAEHDDLIVIYGPVQAIDLDGNPIGHRTLLEPKPPLGYPLTLSNSVLVNYHNYFNGAFKGLVDREKIERHGAWIRKTVHLMNSERCWLFALSLLGRFHFYEDFHYTKRYFNNSTSASWRFTIRNHVSVASTHVQYLWHLGHRFTFGQKLVGTVTLLGLAVRFILLVKLRSSAKAQFFLMNYPGRKWKDRWLAYIDDA